MSKIKFKPEDRWLESDAQIQGRTRQAAHKKGIELTLTMPDGEELVVVVAKLDSASITEFCSMARGNYSERIEEQKAQKARAKFDREMAIDDARAAEGVPAIEAAVSIVDLSPETIAARLVDVAGKRLAYLEKALGLEKEETLLTTILKVLEDAQEDIPEETESFEGEESEAYEGVRSSSGKEYKRQEAIDEPCAGGANSFPITGEKE